MCVAGYEVQVSVHPERSRRMFEALGHPERSRRMFQFIDILMKNHISTSLNMTATVLEFLVQTLNSNLQSATN